MGNELSCTKATAPSLTLAAAIEKAKQYSGATTFKWELPEEEAFEERTAEPQCHILPKSGFGILLRGRRHYPCCPEAGI